MSIIFISYRRDDSAPYAGRLYDRLTAHFGQGQVFMDIDQIEPGEDFVEVIERKVGTCSIAVILIGKSWLAASDAQGKRRLDDPEDFVRLEVAAALKREVRVLPVLVGGATMPRAQQLPEPLASLSRRNAFEISDSRFHTDVDKLIASLERAAGDSDNLGGVPAARPRFTATAKTLSIGGLATLAVAAATVFLLPALRGKGTAAPATAPGMAAPSAASPAFESDPVLGGAISTEDERNRTQARAAFAKSPDVFQIYQTRANQGSADGQYRLAVFYECGNNKDLALATRWYGAAAAQGHLAARTALAALQAPLPADPHERELADVRRGLNCVSRLQENVDESLQQMDDAAKNAIKNIKPG